jgi:hypothetical protein
MAEVEWVFFAKLAVAIGRPVVSAYRDQCSKHRFTQPQILAMLCLMRDEDWTFREVRLTESGESRTALGRQCVPDSKILDRFLRRLGEATLEQTLSEGVRRLMPAEEIRRATVAIDATGLTPGVINIFFVMRDKDQEPGITWRHWLQWTIAVALAYGVILAQTARRGPDNDSATLRLLVDAAHKRGAMGQVWADAACDDEHHHQVRHGAKPRASSQPNMVKRAGALKVYVVFYPNSGPSQMLKCSHNESGLKGEEQMKKPAFTEEQIIYALCQVEMGPQWQTCVASWA